ncbi:MAG TPA: P-loop NTPase fold protein [Streptosporangiaceae bacterium]|jgi:hypothetical protein|nr:P-loop NTPase fold protein [Streptosporangiaceae bacterium]
MTPDTPSLSCWRPEFEPGKVITAIEGDGDDTRPLSFYHEGFRMLCDAIGELPADGSRRVVIFVDDLDRCLPSKALDVLVSMKLFFDVEGCVFIIGLDQGIVEQAVASKYGSGASPGFVRGREKVALAHFA